MKIRLMKLALISSLVLAGGFAFSQNAIKASDLPDGFASLGIKDGVFGADGKNVVVVKNGKDFKDYAERGGFVIYVEGKIDVTDGYLPENAFSETEKLSSLISSCTGGNIKSWSEWRTKFAACMKKTTDYAGNGRQKDIDETMNGYFQKLVNSWKKLVMVNVANNTTIIGVNKDSILRGASLQISGKNNIAIRNITLQDALDLFPHHEENDGFNAQYDCVSVYGSSNIWIDHVTFEDHFSVGPKEFAHVKLADRTDEKWQTTDGFLDMSGNFQNVTISYCHFYNHDKTCLWGSSDKEKLSVTRTVTAHHNYFHNCVQRLPMTRLANVHLYNNYFDVDKKSSFQSSYAIGARFGANINSEGNYFGRGIKYSMQGASKNYGTIYSNKDLDKSSSGKKSGEFKPSKTPLFEVPYSYTLEDAKLLENSIPASAGAGILPVEN